MSTFFAPLGAWLSGPSLVQAGLNPPFGRASALNPPFVQGNHPPFHAYLNPPFVQGHHPPFHIASASAPAGPGADDRAAVSAGSGWPWYGVEPDWARTSMSAMRAYAIGKMRSRIVAPTDPRDDGQDPSKRRPSLWRWDAPYRIKAAAAELLGHCVVSADPAGPTLWWMPAPSQPLAQAKRVLHIRQLGRGFDFQTQIDKVLRAAVEREDRTPEILTQADDLGQYFDAITGIDRDVCRHLGELVETAWEVGHHVIMSFKDALATLRPVERNPRVMPIIPTPGHASTPSGHAAMGALTSRLLAELLGPQRPDRVLQLDRLARRIAFNRVVAGVHFPLDSLAGYRIGQALAQMLIAAAKPRAKLPAESELRLEPDDELDEVDLPSPALADGSPVAELSARWSLMWSAAVSELAQHRT